MSDIVIDYSRADAERRMKLLEMAGGDLKRAMELEQWVQSGTSVRIVVKEKMPDIRTAIPSDLQVSLVDDLKIPAFLDRLKTEAPT